MNPQVFIQALQLTDSFFPVGAFAYSDGLETAAAQGRVHDASTLGVWIDHFLDSVFVPFDGLAVAKCFDAFKANDGAALCQMDEELTAMRPSRSGRMASISVGKRLLSMYEGLRGDGQFSGYLDMIPNGNAAVAYATVFFHCGMDEREAILALGYNRLAGIISAGLRLISMGQQQGQRLLSSSLDKLPAAAEQILQMSDEPLRSFSPILDIHQMNHQYVYSRLFRS